MIIVSQDETKILNFDNIEVIGIGNPLENDNGKFKILVDTTNDNEFSIAEYGTEERAKKVLQKIIGKYREFTIKFDAYNNECERYELPKVFEMPEEWEVL